MASGSILLADDDPLFGKIVERHLTKAGYSVMRTLSGENLISLLSVAEPTVIILDLNMPGMSGIETCQKARIRIGKTIPILFLTNVDTQEAITACLEAGGNDFIIKDKELTSLSSRVELWARRRGTARLESTRYDALFSLSGGSSGNFDPENRVRILLRQPAARDISDSTQKIARMTRHIIEKTADDFGTSEKQLRYLVGYLVGATQGWSTTVPGVKLMFLETIVRIMDMLPHFNDDLIEQILENWNALHKDDDFLEGNKRGSEDAVLWMAGEDVAFKPFPLE